MSDLEKLFDTALNNCQELWGVHAFRRYSAGVFRDQFLASIYDAQMIAVDQLSTRQLKNALDRKPAVLAATKKLFSDERFEESVRSSTNTPSRVRYRIEAMINMLKTI